MVSSPAVVLVVDDGSSESDAALDTAVGLARATGSLLSLLHVKSLSPQVVGTTVTPTQFARLREQGEELVGRRVADIAEKGIEPDFAEVRFGQRIETAVIRTVRELGAEVLVVGARDGGAGRRYVLGDLSLQLARDAPCSVLVVRGESPWPRPDHPDEGHH